MLRADRFSTNAFFEKVQVLTDNFDELYGLVLNKFLTRLDPENFHPLVHSFARLFCDPVKYFHPVWSAPPIYYLLKKNTIMLDVRISTLLIEPCTNELKKMCDCTAGCR